LWLFWRGGGWNPTFSYTEDGRAWVQARELVYTGHDQRPYAKYVGDGNRRIHAIFSDGHAQSWKNGLHYLRYEAEGLYAVGGRKLGTLRDVPLHMSKLDHVYIYSDQGGRAWPHDIALTAEGRPRIVYTRDSAPGRTRSTTRTTTGGSGSAARSWRPALAPTTSHRAARRSTTRTRASSTCRERSARGTRSSSGSRRTKVVHGRRVSSPRALRGSASALSPPEG
jgi:hypothetical protein